MPAAFSAGGKEVMNYATMTLNQADSDYRHGIISQVEWERYCYVWRNGAFRASSEMVSFEDPAARGLSLPALIARAESLIDDTHTFPVFSSEE
jgi:hypothetical protein